MQHVRNSNMFHCSSFWKPLIHRYILNNTVSQKSIAPNHQWIFYIQAVSVHVPHPHRTSTTIPARLHISSASAASGRYQLMSTGSAVYVLPRTRFGERRFFYSGPATCNTLCSDLHEITDISTFRKWLNCVLFDLAYHWLLFALLDVSYSGTVQISRWLIDWLISSCLITAIFGTNITVWICHRKVV